MNWFRTLRRLLRSGPLCRPALPPESAEPTTPEPTATTAPEPAEVPPRGQTETVAPTPTETANRGSTEAPPAEPSASTTPGRSLPTIVVVIGLDFGTSGTKVVVRWLDKSRLASAVDFGTDQAGFSRFSLPSTVALENSRFLFGVDAEKHQGDTVFRSLKRQLMKATGNLRDVSRPEVPPCPKDLDAHPHFLVAVYLGAVLARIRSLVAQERDVNVEFFYNLDIPVSQLGDGPVERGFQTALDAAVDFAEAAGLRCDDYPSLWERWLEVLDRANTGVADPEQKRWELVPESSAIVKGAEAALAPILPNSLRYTAIVDIGAGTTDVGWFRWMTHEEGDRLWFFSAKTCLVGCDQIDDRLLGFLGVSDEDRSRLFPLVREAKPELGTDETVQVAEEYPSLSMEDLSFAVEEVAERCFQGYRASFGEAFPKDRNTDHWRAIRVILVGGGSQLKGFRDQFRVHPMWSYGRDVNLLRPGHPASVRFAAQALGAIGATSSRPEDDDIVFLLPALGLSYPALDIPQLGLPDEIPSSPPPSRGPTGIYDYEAPDDD